MSISRQIESAWQRPVSWILLLLPLSWLFRVIATLRRLYYQKISPRADLPVPVIIVGNISVGGTGKTPLLIAMAEWLISQGFRPGVISRGYGGAAIDHPVFVTPGMPSKEAGDEPLLLANVCPVVIDPDRYRAAKFLLENSDCDVILSDDGLQHYRLPRQVEVVVVDGQRGFGNGQCLPAGPLREPVNRLKEADFVITNHNGSGDVPSPLVDGQINGYGLQIEPIQLRHLRTGLCLSVQDSEIEGWQLGCKVHAVAGIGNPRRFIDTLAQLGLEAELHAWPDHHRFDGCEFEFPDDRPVVITAKDAVKCGSIENDHLWVLDISAKPDIEFLEQLKIRINQIKLSDD